MATTPSYYLSWLAFSLPMKAYPVARDETSDLKNLHQPCSAALAFLKKCTVCLKEAPPAEIVKGYKAPTGDWVIVTDEEIAATTSEASKAMQVEHFVLFETVDPSWLGKAYFLTASDPATSKPYLLFKNAMFDTGKAAVVTYASRGHDKLGIIRATDESLILHELYYASEMRTLEAQTRVALKDVQPSTDELALASQLIDESTQAFDVSPFSDGSFDRLKKLIQDKIDGVVPAPATPKPAPPAAVDLMAALRASLAQRQSDAKKPPVKAEPVAAKPGKKKKVA